MYRNLGITYKMEGALPSRSSTIRRTWQLRRRWVTGRGRAGRTRTLAFATCTWESTSKQSPIKQDAMPWHLSYVSCLDDKVREAAKWLEAALDGGQGFARLHLAHRARRRPRAATLGPGVPADLPSYFSNACVLGEAHARESTEAKQAGHARRPTGGGADKGCRHQCCSGFLKIRRVQRGRDTRAGVGKRGARTRPCSSAAAAV